jgi:hypothetical protein
VEFIRLGVGSRRAVGGHGENKAKQADRRGREFIAIFKRRKRRGKAKAELWHVR